MLKINGAVFYRATVAQNTFRQMVEGWEDNKEQPELPDSTKSLLISHTESLEEILQLLGANDLNSE